MGNHHLRRILLFEKLEEDTHRDVGERIGRFPDPGQDNFLRWYDALIAPADDRPSAVRQGLAQAKAPIRDEVEIQGLKRDLGAWGKPLGEQIRAAECSEDLAALCVDHTPDDQRMGPISHSSLPCASIV